MGCHARTYVTNVRQGFSIPPAAHTTHGHRVVAVDADSQKHSPCVKTAYGTARVDMARHGSVQHKTTHVLTVREGWWQYQQVVPAPNIGTSKLLTCEQIHRDTGNRQP